MTLTTLALVTVIALAVLVCIGALFVAVDIWASPSRSRLIRRRDPDLFIDQWRSERRQRLLELQRPHAPTAPGSRADRHPVDAPRTFWGHGRSKQGVPNMTKNDDLMQVEEDDLMQAEWAQWQVICTVLAALGAVSRADLHTPAHADQSAGCRLLNAIRYWGDLRAEQGTLIALRGDTEH